MWFEQVLFFVAAAGAIAGALGVVLLRNPFYTVLSLVVHLFALAMLFLLLHAEFLAAAQVVVYAGAVMVLYVFVVAYIGGVDEPLRPRARRRRARSARCSRPRCSSSCAIAVVATGLQALDTRGADARPGLRLAGRDRRAAAHEVPRRRSRRRRSCCSSPPWARSCWRAAAAGLEDEGTGPMRSRDDVPPTGDRSRSASEAAG